MADYRHHHHHHHHHYHRDVGRPDLPSPNRHRLRRSREHRMICGVCGGLAEYFGWRPGLVRLAALLSLIVFPPTTIIAYIVACCVMKRPLALQRQPNWNEEDARFWRTVSTRPRVTFSQLRHMFRGLEDRIADMERTVTAEEYRLNRAFREIEDRPGRHDGGQRPRSGPR